MGSKNNKPLPPFMRHPPLLPNTVHPDPYGPSIRPQLGGFPPFEMLHRPEILEQKITTQHAEMQKLVTENLRLAATHETLRQELAAAKHELQLVHTHIGAMKAEKENQTMGLKDKIARIEAELKAADPLKVELQKARAEAQSLVAERQELILKAQKMNQDLQRTHASTQQIPVLLSELEALRQELQHCRATYEYDRKYYHDHLESLKVMEKEYTAMANEVEKLRTELNNTTNLERTGVAYGNSTVHNESDATNNYPVTQNVYGDAYGIAQGRGPPPTMGNASGVAAPASNSPNFGARAGPPNSSKQAHDPSKMPNYDPQRGRPGPGYDLQRGATGATYDAQRGGPGYPGYDAYRSLGSGSGYEYSGGTNYEAAGHEAIAGVGTQGQIGHSRNMVYGSAAPLSGNIATGYDGALRGAHR
ncbi:hypothetical protein DM860_008501 [Cuscuta australis]|uniref:Protein FLX-like 2 n=1 Tax=Cuscuta australis TaxID=267555 RepID=A0A328DA48_9ASTE|nr:hypothetical protein DM860_008501 [Cuscuta australis]